MSLRKLLGKDEKFFDLLEASAEEAKASTAQLGRFLLNIEDPTKRPVRLTEPPPGVLIPVDVSRDGVEDWLIRLEREHFVALALMPKTQARIKHMLETGKPLRT